MVESPPVFRRGEFGRGDSATPAWILLAYGNNGSLGDWPRDSFCFGEPVPRPCTFEASLTALREIRRAAPAERFALAIVPSIWARASTAPTGQIKCPS